MAPKPSYQLLLWSVPTVALLLTCLWYRRKRNSLRSDPGGTASVNSTSFPLKRPDPCQKPAAVQSESQFESTLQVKAGEKYSCSTAPDLEHKEVGSAEDLCRKIETDYPAASVQGDYPYTPENHSVVQDTSSVQENSLKSHELVSHIKLDTVVVLETKEEFEKHKETDNKVSESQEETEEETVCKEKSEKEIECKEKGEEERECPSKSKEEAKCKEESIETECKEETSFNREISKSEQVGSINKVHVLSEVTLEDISDKSIDILNVQHVEESDTTTKPSGGTVSVSDRFLCKQQAEEICASSSDTCVVTNSEEPECIDDDFDCTVLQSSPCESCIISDSAVKNQHFEDIEEASVKSAVNTSGLVNEENCSSSSVTAERTVMARKSSTDLAMERNADSDGAAARRECNLSVSEQRKSGIENVQVERDSANHSPADVMLGSPAISNYSDANSEGSSDSGKGCSDMATPPPRTPASGSSLAGDVPSIYEFVLPQHLVGRLIGRYGAFVHQIKEKTNANILIKRHPDTTKLKICAIEGNQMGIDRALEMIREKFPLKKYPNVTLEQVCFVPAAPVFPVPQCVQLQLVEGVNNDVIVSYMVTPAHMFLQQPTHPTFLNLNAQAAYMQACYSEPTVPALPRPVAADVICVAPVMGDWCRAQVVSDEADNGTCTIRLLDYGGYDIVDCSVLRQIRQDFMLLPFQAAEAYLANISPAGGVEEEWSQEAFDVLEELTKGQVVEAQVAGYAENCVPIVYLYSIVRSKAIFVNYELVKRGLAEWTNGCTIMNGKGVAAEGDRAEECNREVTVEQ